MTPRPTALVIGAGVAGLATASLLAREGYQVTVIERHETVGGRAGEFSTADAPGFRWDTGPSWYLMPEAFEYFFQQLGTSSAEQLELVELAPAYRVMSEGDSAIDVHSGIDSVARLFGSIEPGADKTVRTYLQQAGENYDLALRHFLYTTFSSLRPLVHRDVLRRAPGLLTLLGRSLESFVSRRFRDPLLRQILSYPAVFLSSQPSDTPALYHLMSYTDLVQGVRYPQGGFARIIDALYRLAQDNEVNFVFNTEATAITTDSSQAGTHVTGLQLRASDGKSYHRHADIVVSCADLHHTETQLLPEALRTFPEKYFASRNPGIGTVLVLLGVRGQLPQLSHHNLLFSQDWSPDFAAVFGRDHAERLHGASKSIYVSMTSATDDSAAPDGHENLFVLIPVRADKNLGHGNLYHDQASPAVESIASAAISQIAQWADIPDLKERIVAQYSLGPADFYERYHSWHAGALGPAHTLRQSAFLRGRNASRSVAGLYYAGGTTVPGVGVPMCLISAHNVITRLREDAERN